MGALPLAEFGFVQGPIQIGRSRVLSHFAVLQVAGLGEHPPRKAIDLVFG